MQPNRLQCPHCSVVLRIRDRKHVGRQVDCPDCGGSIQVLADGPNQLELVKAETASLPPTETAPAATVAVMAKSVATPTAELTRLQHWTATLTSATGIAWSVAAVSGVALILLAWPFGAGEPKPTDADKSSPAVTVDNETPDKPAIPLKPQQPGDDAITVQSRLEALGRSINEFAGEHERFPALHPAVGDLTEEQRLSWLADLVASQDAANGPQPLWDQPWRDPLNDRFVRRLLSDFHNPNVEQLTGPNRYPATHFAGIAGVGADAPTLPVSHPRAGIFGHNRRTRTTDVKDGLTNTMMVAGVTQKIGSWAGNGPATIRPFTREPYINGPDGFGTGEGQGMSVLMADGSVRFLSSKTSPVLLRRMAAMSDGFPLDLAIPGNPGDPPPVTPPKLPEPPVAQVNPQAKPKADVVALNQPPVIAPEPPRTIDVAALLKQPILEYEQTKATPLRVLLGEVEEMIGVPIRTDDKRLGASAAQLAKPFTLKKLENTTAGDILQALVEQAGLAYVIENNAIDITPQ